jgi:preprotein translocase subunit SecG
MRAFFVFLLTFVLVLASVFVVLVILMQKPSANAGMGASLGGGAAESAFGSDTVRVLTKWTVGGIVVFFVASFLLSMLHIGAHGRRHSAGSGISVERIIDSSDKPDR